MDLVENKDSIPTHAAEFRRVAALLDKNVGEKFGGVWLIIDPQGEQIESLMINDGTPGLFWGTLKAVCEQKINEIDAQSRQLRPGFPTR